MNIVYHSSSLAQNSADGIVTVALQVRQYTEEAATFFHKPFLLKSKLGSKLLNEWHINLTPSPQKGCEEVLMSRSLVKRRWYNNTLKRPNMWFQWVSIWKPKDYAKRKQIFWAWNCLFLWLSLVMGGKTILLGLSTLTLTRRPYLTLAKEDFAKKNFWAFLH